MRGYITFPTFTQNIRGENVIQISEDNLFEEIEDLYQVIELRGPGRSLWNYGYKELSLSRYFSPTQTKSELQALVLVRSVTDITITNPHHYNLQQLKLGPSL